MELFLIISIRKLDNKPPFITLKYCILNFVLCPYLLVSFIHQLSKMIWISINVLSIKNFGAFKKPSKYMDSLCKTTELIFNTYKEQMLTNNAIIFLILKVSSKINTKSYFNSIKNHILNQSPINNHLLQWIKMIFKIFFPTRLRYRLKYRTQHNNKIQSHWFEVIHFKNQ